jgi:hypothetical protein
VGIDYRTRCKIGKVQVLPTLGELKLVIPTESDANIIRVFTTAKTNAQHLFSAYVIADSFGVEVQEAND